MTIHRTITRRIACLATAAAVALGLGGSLESPAAAPSKRNEAIDAVRAAVTESFSREPGYRPGDFVTRKQVEHALDHVERAAKDTIRRDDRERLLKSAVDDRSFLAQQLSTPQSKPFMRRVAALPGGFDLLDRMGQMQQGRSTVTRLVRGPDGHKLLEYMLQSKGGAELERMLARDPGNADFAKPTGKIYTAEQLTAALEQLLRR